MDGSKRCSKCGDEKLRQEFNKHNGSRDGLQGYCRTCQRKRVDETKPQLKLVWAAWYRKNKKRKQALAKKWEKTEKGKAKLFRERKKREEAIKRATPAWLTQEQRLELALIFSNCPEGFACDHTLPIRGKEICGLNVPWNLQYLPRAENLKKGNRFIPYIEIFEPRRAKK